MSGRKLVVKEIQVIQALWKKARILSKEDAKIECQIKRLGGDLDKIRMKSIKINQEIWKLNRVLETKSNFIVN